jgi:hypothetical protein
MRKGQGNSPVSPVLCASPGLTFLLRLHISSRMTISKDFMDNVEASVYIVPFDGAMVTILHPLILKR